jgi:hypothetical protein
MIAGRVTSEAEVFAELDRAGFVRTNVYTFTGQYWRHTPTMRNLLVPKSLDGHYPDWMVADIRELMKKAI